jgi:uracil-DNA glycosylase
MAVSSEFDPGPPAAIAKHLAKVPAYSPQQRAWFWYDWGPVFYRGRLNGSAKLLAIASDPGPSERVAGRTLVGDAGQRIQGFLSKLGLTKSYVLVNAYAYALLPSRSDDALPMLNEDVHRTWRNKLLDDVTDSSLQAIVAFGTNAQKALDLWSPRPSVPVFKIPHPSSRNPTKLINEWRQAIADLRAIVTPDADGNAGSPNYGTGFKETDYARIPPRDLPFGMPAWFGDDAWGRKAHPRHNNSVDRPGSDLKHTLIWKSPTGQP